MLAICKIANNTILKRIKLTAALQIQIEGAFLTQEQDFIQSIKNEVMFDGGWKPEKDDVLIVAPTDEMTDIWKSSLQNIMSLPELDAKNFNKEHIKALCVSVGDGDNKRILIQNFSSRQILNRGLSLMLSGDTFTQLSDPAFSMATNLSGILEEDTFKFKSYSNVRMIFDLTNLYSEATNNQIDTFLSHKNLSVADLNFLKQSADQTMRKLVHALSTKKIFDLYDIETLAHSANVHDFPLNIADGLLVIPSDKAEIKKLLYFLDDAYFKGSLSGESYITNSKRTAN